MSNSILSYSVEKEEKYALQLRCQWTLNMNLSSFKQQALFF